MLGEKLLLKDNGDGIDNVELKTEPTENAEICPMAGITSKVENDSKENSGNGSEDAKDPKAPSSVVIATADDYNKNNSLCKFIMQHALVQLSAELFSTSFYE